MHTNKKPKGVHATSPSGEQPGLSCTGPDSQFFLGNILQEGLKSKKNSRLRTIASQIKDDYNSSQIYR